MAMSFQQALDTAKAMAQQHGVSVRINRTGDNQWEVDAPQALANAVEQEHQEFLREMEDDELDSEHQEREAAREQSEINRELLSEIYDDMDAQRRSDETGWYYPDGPDDSDA